MFQSNNRQRQRVLGALMIAIVFFTSKQKKRKLNALMSKLAVKNKMQSSRPHRYCISLNNMLKKS